MTQHDSNELRLHLQSLFLCSGSMMRHAVDVLEKCHRFKLTLELTGKENPGYQAFVAIGCKLCVNILEVETPSSNTKKCIEWMGAAATTHARAWIPPESMRSGDLHVRLPFYLKYHLQNFQIHDATFPKLAFDCFSILQYIIDHFNPRGFSVSTRVFKYLLAWEQMGRLINPGFLLNQDAVETLHAHIAFLPECLQLYLGFCTGAEGERLSQEGKLLGHPFNQQSLKQKQYEAIGFRGKMKPAPYLVQHYFWDIDQLITISKNTWWLFNYGIGHKSTDHERVTQCLMLRLNGKSELDICAEMMFESSEHYRDWLTKQYIDIAPKSIADPFENWLKACEYFELEPNADFLDGAKGTDSQHTPNKNAAITESPFKIIKPPQPVTKPLPEPIREFRHSPDYRSVVSISGEQFFLTQKQAQVVQILHEALKNSTPELSLGHLVNEVYPNAAENRLKKLFSNDPAWDGLVESGRRRDTIRLKS